jgi:NAD(P)-dependent dehydrogenase (short-subunit alcohol dehydrogenase family)
VIADISPAYDAVAGLKRLGAQASNFQCDVSSESEVRDLAKAVCEEFGAADILVNNAGIYPTSSFCEMTFAEWRRVLSVNLDSVFLTSHAFIPGMRARGWGRIVNMASGMIWMTLTGYGHYIASKAGVIGLSRALASEVAEHGITVNAISPSLVRVERTARECSPEEFEFLVQAQVIKRTEVATDLAGTLSFLCSDDAAFMTGQTISVDGGIVRL